MKKPMLLLATIMLTQLALTASAQQVVPPDADRFRLAATIRDIMDTMIDPGADRIWDSVSTEISPNGVIDKIPRNDREWNEIRKSALTLVEGANLLLLSGRKVARPGEKSKNPNVEMEPDQIEGLIQKDPADWSARVRDLQNVSATILNAIEAKDVARIRDAGAALDQSCENCHLKYWYPAAAPSR